MDLLIVNFHHFKKIKLVVIIVNKFDWIIKLTNKNNTKVSFFHYKYPENILKVSSFNKNEQSRFHKCQNCPVGTF